MYEQRGPGGIPPSAPARVRRIRATAYSLVAEADDLDELVGVECGTADEGAVHVGLRHDRRDVARTSPSRRTGYGPRRPAPASTARRDGRGSHRRPPARPRGWRPRRSRWPRPARRRSRWSRPARPGCPSARRRAGPACRTTWSPALRMSRPSPTQRIGVRPCLKAAFTLALQISSFSPWYWRRSLWPTATNVHFSLASIGPEISPVYAPESCAEMSWAPYLIFSLSPSTSVCTERRSVKGGRTATSTAS